MSSNSEQAFWIRIFLIDGRPDGLQLVEVSNWDGCGLVCSRSRYPEAVKVRPELKRTGVYVLLGPAEDDDLPTIYVGSGEPVCDRFDDHIRNRDFWTWCVAFTRKDDSLNKAQVGYLESRLHELASSVKRCSLDNANKPQRPSLSEAEEAEAKGFLSYMLDVLPVLGVSAFSTPGKKSHGGPALQIKAKGIAAKGYEDEDGFVVLRDSTAVLKETNSCPSGNTAKRSALVQQGVFKKVKDKYVLQQDYTFSSPSKAAGVILGQSANGLDLWKDSKNRSLKQLQSAKVK